MNYNQLTAREDVEPPQLARMHGEGAGTLQRQSRPRGPRTVNSDPHTTGAPAVACWLDTWRPFFLQAFVLSG
jgi:hypothetical protein